MKSTFAKLALSFTLCAMCTGVAMADGSAFTPLNFDDTAYSGSGSTAPAQTTTINSAAAEAAGNESMVADILSFFAGVAAAFLISYTLIKNTQYKGKFSEIISFILLITLGGIFILFTFAPPLIPLFEDQMTKTYGI